MLSIFMKNPFRLPETILLMILLAACGEQQTTPTPPQPHVSHETSSAVSPPISSNKQPEKSSPPLVQSARNQIGKTVRYDPAYSTLKYPMGDVPLEKGVCTDVVIRALREQNMDLQQLVHQDMKKNFSVYPKRWGLKRPDPNIDHRRVPNLITFFTRQGWAVPQKGDFQAGDIVTWELNGNRLPHIGIVSDRTNGDTPLIIHNIGAGTQEEDILHQHTITGHFRLPEK
ncbi:DUF1287 domain-containing protein [Alysiella filiformis]|nr:DUF1287 domain-containing protein [Alysiella filiformis]UBQ55224.1 DUF1287 domain-containing protein [Alysiella filiformis DSM 16848]